MYMLLGLVALVEAQLLYQSVTKQSEEYENYSFVVPSTPFPFALLHLNVSPSSLACLLVVGIQRPPSVYLETGKLQGNYEAADLTSFALGRSEAFVQLNIWEAQANTTLYLGVLLPERPIEGVSVLLEAWGHSGELCPLNCSQHGVCSMGVCECRQPWVEQDCSLKVAYLELGQNYDIIVPPGTYRFFTTLYNSQNTLQLSLKRQQSDAQLFVSFGSSNEPPTALLHSATQWLDSSTPSLELPFNPETFGLFGLLFSLRSSDHSSQAVVSMSFQQTEVASSSNVYVILGALLGVGAIMLSCCMLCLRCIYHRRRIRHTGARVHVYQSWSHQSLEQEKGLFEPSQVDFDPSAPQDCTICLDGLSVKQAVTELPCKHVFHTVCINAWFETQRCCCLCKQSYTFTP